ncbi:MAG: methyl-accepting chemotaxis protein signaling domain protein [Bacillota bacterium]|nr:methyl-accepting chemotaxis protein signaling domain protein [Bacillota bacterium]
MKVTDTKIRGRSISRKILWIFITMVFLITVLIASFSIHQYRSEVLLLKAHQAESIGRLTASQIDSDAFRILAKSSSETDYYSESKALISEAKEVSGVKYLYVVVPIGNQQIRYIVEGQASGDNPEDIFEFDTIVDYADFFDTDEEGLAFEAAVENGQVFNNGLYQDPNFGYMLTVFTPMLDSKGKTVGMVGVDLDADDIMAEVYRLVILLAAIALIGILGVVIGARILIRKNITKPLEQIVLASDSLAAGNVSVDLTVHSDDEIGRLAGSFRKMIENIREQANSAQRIAAGDLSAEVEPKSDQDILSISLNNVIHELNKLTAETAMLTGAAIDGNLDQRGSAEAFHGGYREIVNGINSTLDALIRPLRMAAEYMDQISKGEIPPVITEEYKGDFNGIKNNINTCIRAINLLVEDMNTLSMAAIEGQLDTRVDQDRHSGDFGRVIEGVNATLDAVIGPLKVAAEYLKEIGRGEIPEKLTASYSGDFERIKDDINSCVDGLGGLIEGNDVMYRMSLNDYSVKVEGRYLGIYQNIAESVNLINYRMNRVVEILTHVAAGDLSDLQNIIDGGKRSEDDTLVPALIAMIENIQNLVDETGKLSEAAIEGNLQVRGNSSTFKGQFSNVIDGVNATLDAVISPIEEAAAVLKELAKGNLQVSMNGSYRGDHAEIKLALNSTISNLQTYIGDISAVLAQMAGGNLELSITADYMGDFVEIKNSLNNIIVSLSGVMGDIRNAADQVNTGSRQVSTGSQSLSQGSIQQTSAIQELTASISEIASQTKRNAVNAGKASELAAEARNDVVKGNDQMQGMLGSMEEINDSSANISKIIKVIDDIAFQTNILALNAAVEAARAGQHGKGFAVVAEEVRNLAARSAAAARETTELIEGSITKVQHGMKIANETASSLKETVGRIETTADLVGSIADASKEQATGIDMVNKGIEQVAQVAQNNSATAEESAAASEQLSSQSEMLKEMVGRFKVNAGVKVLPGVSAGLLEEGKFGEKQDRFKSKQDRFEKPKGPQILLDDTELDKY